MEAISFVMPVFNAEKTIERALRSTLACMSSSDELIIIDDASTDETQKKISEVSDSRILCLANEKNLGVALSINKGVLEASNSLIARMDADDISLPWRRAVITRVLQKTNSDFVFSSAFIFGASLKFPLPQPRFRLKVGSFSEELSRGNPFVHSTMLARRESIIALGLYRQTQMEDYDLWIRASLAGFQFSQSPVPTILYRQHENQVTKSEEWQVDNFPPALRTLRERVGWKDASSPRTVFERIWQWNHRDGSKR